MSKPWTKMKSDIRYCLQSKGNLRGFPADLPSLLTVWPTYDGYVKDDLEQVGRELDDGTDGAWALILAKAVDSLLKAQNLYLTTLECQAAPWYWLRYPHRQYWKSSPKSLDFDYLRMRESWSHEHCLHLIGACRVSPPLEELPVSDWMNQGFACLELGIEEPVLYGYWPDPKPFLDKLDKAAAEHGHQLVESMAFVSHWQTAGQPGPPPNYLRPN